MSNLVRKHRLEFYDDIDTLLRYKTFKTEEDAENFISNSIPEFSDELVFYVGSYLSDMSCKVCNRAIGIGTKHIQVNNPKPLHNRDFVDSDEETYYCLRCVSETPVTITHYTANDGRYLGTDQDISISQNFTNYEKVED